MPHMTRKTRSSAARVLGTTAAVLTLSGCATKGDLRNLQNELRALSARQDTLLLQLRTQALSTQDTLRTQSNQIFDFRGEISNQLRQIAESLSRIEALAGQNQAGLAGVRDQLANLRRDQGRSSGLGVRDSSAVGGAVAPGGGDAAQLYRTAQEQLNRNQLSTARMAFRQFVDSYPNHELAPDAHFFLADILFQQEQLDEALTAFREIQERFPAAARVPAALYRIALIQIEQEDIDDAIDTLERIVNTYPGTLDAELAAEKLDEIR